MVEDGVKSLEGSATFFVTSFCLAMICLLAIYVGGTYGGSYASILINIPGTAAAAATSCAITPGVRKPLA